MKAVCPYCEREFVRKRRNQVYCRQGCRQGNYIQRKKGHVTHGLAAFPVKDTKNVYDPSVLLSLDNPSTPQNVSNPSSNSVAGKGSEKWALSARSNHFFNKGATKNNIPAKPDGLLTHQAIPHQENTEPSTIRHKRKKRIKPVRRFEIPDGYFNSIHKENKPQEKESDLNNDGLYTPIMQPPGPVLDYSVPVEQIPPQLPGEGLISYMVKYGLTLPVLPVNFTVELFPHWSDKDKKAYLIVNEKMVEAFQMLMKANERKIKPEYLKRIRKRLHELTDGLYTLFTPDDYPFSRFIRLVKCKLDSLIDKTKKIDEFDLELPRELSDQIMLVCLQAGLKH